MGTIDINNEELNINELQEILAVEKLDHICSIIKFKFGIECDWEIDGELEEFTIYLEDEVEDVCFNHTYSLEDLIDCDVTEQAYFLRRWLNTCISLKCIQDYEKERGKNPYNNIVPIRR
ncbi:MULTISPECIES: hypothetical protein [Bacillales]|uniref:Uncharacterized protein n=1 Tax=Ureibacillus massiliensis 4400831 = CIP 108448 = CCUG 49529 TaxID=1211035 RepID=A0A0A3J2D6_9BACL|nr:MULTISPECIES: hypothetical protein [Bacillales]KGR89860.1 hypothetical protein CD30_14830 [Ureibacillus massiliensis 4400831 = CIP 108448 = CCUG 49529]